MKTSLTTLAAIGLAALLTGCGDSSSTSTPSPTPPPPAPAAPKAPEAPAKPAEPAPKPAAEAPKAAEPAKDKLQDAAKAVQGAVADAGAAAQEQFNALVADVKKLISEGKTTEAVQKVQAAFSSLKLTPEQQKIVDDLKKQAQEALSKKGVDAATKAVGDLLAPKPQK